MTNFPEKLDFSNFVVIRTSCLECSAAVFEKSLERYLPQKHAFSQDLRYHKVKVLRPYLVVLELQGFAASGIQGNSGMSEKMQDMRI